MKLQHNLHLAYCTNVHRGETWAETFAALDCHTLPVRRRVAAGRSYAIGLRLGCRAAEELAQPDTLLAFRRWLDRHDCYVFTINGFPYGSFHGTRVKEQVYAPDWSAPERVAYTNRLFDLLVQLLPPGVAGSVSTVPASFKGFIAGDPGRRSAIFSNLTECGRHIAALSEKTGRDLHLGLEPEPLCLLETSEETVDFFNEWRARDRAAETLLPFVGVNYDCCHLAVEFESAPAALDRIVGAGIRLSKLHLSSALRVRPDDEGRRALAAFVEPTYLHQVVVGQPVNVAPAGVAQPVSAESRASPGAPPAADPARRSAFERPGTADLPPEGGTTNAASSPAAYEVRRRFVDLPEALADAEPSRPDDEWRIHFHVPLHASPGRPFSDTRDHLLGALDWLAAHPGACHHVEMETYTWEVLPPALRLPIEDQLVREYAWSLGALAQRGLADAALAVPCAQEADA
jgi:hypothetical protein